MAGLNLTTNTVSDAFTKLGYSRSVGDKRIKIYENCGKIGSLHYRNITNEDIKIVIAGSRGEGVGISLDCDVDKVFIHRSVMCFEKFPRTDDHTDFEAKFLLDFENVPPGYCQLRFIPTKGNQISMKSSFQRNIENAFQNENGNLYLRNDQLMTNAMNHLKRDGYLEESYVYDVTDGPAKPYQCQIPCTNDFISFDDVLAFRCICPSVINKWCERERRHDWPGTDVIQKVKNVDVLVVPVGEDEEKVLQWRVSLVFAELALVHSFNDIQLKVYVALKMLAKAELKKICVNITSYVMKNVMFWISEKTDIHNFERSQFFERIADALRYLRDCVYEGVLPNYMIPERNMMKNKLSEVEKEDVLRHIDSLLAEGPHALLRCPEIKEYFNDDVDTRAEKIELRESIEQAILSLYSLPPSEGVEMLKEAFKVDTDLNVINFFRNKIFPKIRKSNPFDFFHHFISKTDDELLVYFITQKYRLGQGGKSSKKSEAKATAENLKRKTEDVNAEYVNEELVTKKKVRKIAAVTDDQRDGQ